jgi:hypothetical protein
VAALLLDVAQGWRMMWRGIDGLMRAREVMP